MENIAAKDVVGLDSILAYAGRLSFVFHRYRLLSTENEHLIPSVVEEHISLLSSTIGTLNEVLGLLKREDAGKSLNHVFSDDGLQFVNLLVGECAKVLGKIAPTATKAAQKVERKKNGKMAKKAKENIIAPVVPTQLELDEEKFLNDLETAVWYRVDNDTYAYLERFKKIQLHLLLVYQVVTGGSLLGDLSSGKVDIEKIVLYHERINRTFDLVCRSSPSRRRNFRSSSSSAYTLSGSDTDIDVGSIFLGTGRNPRSNFATHCPPPPPPFPPVDGCLPQPALRVVRAAPPPPPPAMAFMPRPPTPNSTSSPRFINLNTNPPSYESHRGSTTPPLKQALPLTHPPISPRILSDEKGEDNKADLVTKKEEEEVVNNNAEPRAPEGQLFNSPHNRLSFKIRSLFRSKESLAAEMKKVLESTSSVLDAFLIQGYDVRPIPHSAFHSLETTHMRTILSQLNDNSWLETFSNLTRVEHSTLGIALCPCGQTKLRREVVVLKVLQENKNNLWMRLIANKSVTPLLPQHSNGRIILAIRFPVPPTSPGVSQPGPPPPGVLSGPPPPPPRHPGALVVLKPPPPPPASAPRPQFNSSQAHIYSDAEINWLLSQHTLSNTLFDKPSLTSHLLRTCFKVIITHEYNTLPDIVARVDSFNKRGSSVINSQLRLTDQQAIHMTQILEDLQVKERDFRFEWCWVELSLHNSIGEVDLAMRGQAAQTATMMHLIARRSLKREYKPSEVYNLLVRGPPRPGFNNGLPPRPGPPVGIPMPGPPPPPPQPQPVAGPSVFIDRFRPRPRGNRRARARDMSMRDRDDSGSSGSDSDTTYDSRIRRVRRTCRNDRRMGRRYSDSEISDDSDDDEDVIKIPIILKRGDDVVKEAFRSLDRPSTGDVEKSTGRVRESS
ncbi:uncharacterized protein EAF02_003836 [Botrytis sinoallii]|uniref:uncharacterized protein n=1 Tax=Botrytis sinoallii TaxID=1463999 RepID=UPI001901B1D6|nr:uncharacterized protein EAF02_003836 [Botrytis sinoallii]KAF7887189.1 hypothetical protein EAF02_003836 [Botrytis sinoallii]